MTQTNRRWPLAFALAIVLFLFTATTTVQAASDPPYTVSTDRFHEDTQILLTEAQQSSGYIQSVNNGDWIESIRSNPVGAYHHDGTWTISGALGQYAYVIGRDIDNLDDMQKDCAAANRLYHHYRPYLTAENQQLLDAEFKQLMAGDAAYRYQHGRTTVGNFVAAFEQDFGDHVTAVKKVKAKKAPKKLKMPKKLKLAKYKKSKILYVDKTVYNRVHTPKKASQIIATMVHDAVNGRFEQTKLVAKFYLPVGAYSKFGRYLPEPAEYTQTLTASIFDAFKDTDIAKGGDPEMAASLKDIGAAKGVNPDLVKSLQDQLQGSQSLQDDTNNFFGKFVNKITKNKLGDGAVIWTSAKQAWDNFSTATKTGYKQNAERLASQIIRNTGKKGVVISTYAHTSRPNTYTVTAWNGQSIKNTYTGPITQNVVTSLTTQISVK